MNKQQLIEKVATTLGRKDAKAAVETVLDAIARELAAGGTVSVTGFGTFDTRHAPFRMARNPQTSEQIVVPESTKPRFRPGQNLLDLVNGDKAVPVDGSAIAKAPKGSLGGTR
jgi:DNA-binding protein HU-beta